MIASPQSAAPLDKLAEIVTCKPRKYCRAKFAIGNGIIQYDRPQLLQNLDGTTSGFFGSAQELLVALPCLTVNGSNQFVLHLDDGIGGFGTRGMQEAQDNGNSLG